MKTDLIEVVLYVVIFGVIGIASLVQAARRARQQRPQDEDRARAQPPRGPADEVRVFLEEVARRAGRQMGYPEAPPKPAPPPRPAAEAPPTPARPARPERKPVPRKKAAPPAARRPLLPPELLIAEEEAPAERRVGAAQARRKQPSVSWFERLPKRPLARAIVLREILGPPRSTHPRDEMF